MFARRNTTPPQHGRAPDGAQLGSAAQEPSGRPVAAPSSGHRLADLRVQPLPASSGAQPVQCDETEEAAAKRIQRVFRNRQYRRLKEQYHQALGMNSVGRALLTDPHVRFARLTHRPSEAPVYSSNPENHYEGAINVLPPSEAVHSLSNPEEYSATYTHEALHKAHETWAPKVFQERKRSPGTHLGWSNAEEEFTITGRDMVFRPPRFSAFPNSVLNENRARSEMGLKPRFSHAGQAEDLPFDMSAEDYAERQEQRRRESSNFSLDFSAEFGSGRGRGRGGPPPGLAARLSQGGRGRGSKK